MSRVLFAEYQVGSSLYGTRTPDSDNDVLQLWFPSLEELVENRSVTIPQRLQGSTDTRGRLLGQFVMGLGHNLDDSLLALHVPEFRLLTYLWYSQAFLTRLLKTATDMWEYNPENRKVRAHAYRYWQAYVNLSNQPTAPLYPMPEREVDTYLEIKSGRGVGGFDWNPTTRVDLGLRQYIDKESLAEWVWDRYNQHFNSTGGT